nr:uncharacterized protein LOC128688886 [Cherax quadricarinatus]
MTPHTLDPKQTLEALQTLLADSGKETTKYEVVENKQKDETFFEKSDLGMHSSCRNPYPCCYRSTCLYGHSGQLCTVLGNRWILAELEGAFVLVYVGLQVLGNQRYTCRILWRGENPIPLSEVPDGTRIHFDAITSPNSEILQALVIWIERKPTVCVDTNDEHSYMFIDGRGLICDLSSLSTNDRDIRVKFDDNVVNVEVCDDVIFVDGNKSKMMHLHKDNSSPVYATVFKLLQGDEAGTLKYVCTCLWTGQRPPINALPMNLEQRKTYRRKSHGLYIQSKCMYTLYCDVDSVPSISKNVGKLTFSIDGIKQWLPFTRDQLYSIVKGQSPSLTCKGNLKAHILKQEHDSEDAKWTVLMIKSHSSSLCMVDNSCGRINEKSNHKALQIAMDEINENLANIEGNFKKEVVHKNVESNELINANHTQDEKIERDKINNSNSHVRPQPKSTTSLASQVKPLTSNLNNQVTPQISSTTSLNSKVKPQTSNTTSLNNQARPQTSSTTSLDNKVRPQTSSTSSLSSQWRSQTGSTSSLCNKLRPQTSSATNLSNQQELQNYVKHGALATQPTLDCLTCSVAEVRGDMVILRAAGKFVLATKENIFFNQVKITKPIDLKSELKKFQTVGTVFYEVDRPIDIWGYTVQHVAVLAWAGKKPPDTHNIIRNWNPQNLLLKNNHNSLSPGIQGNDSTKEKIFDASCCIIEIVLDTAILVVRSKYLEGGTRKMVINISNLFIDGFPVTKKQLKSLPSDNLWHCLVQQGSLCKERDKQSEFVVTLAWQGKKPNSYSSQIKETRPCNSSNTNKICTLVKPQTKSTSNSVKPDNSITGNLTSQKKPQNTNICTLTNKVGSQPNSISKLTNKVTLPSNDNNPKVANQRELEYLTCSLVEVETAAVILRATGKFILLQNKDLFINEERVSDSRNIKSMLKKFSNIGAIIYEANISMELYGYNIKHVAVVGWAGKKPLDAENIVKTWKSKPFVLWKGKTESQSSKIHKQNAPHKDEILETSCKIIKVNQTTGILKIYSKFLENGMGEAEVSISSMYKDGQRVSREQLGQLSLYFWNCIVQKRSLCKMKKGQPEFIATLAWQGKKPSFYPVSKDKHQHSISKDNLGSGMWPQTKSTHSLTSQLRPQASSPSSLSSQGRSQTSSEVRPQISSTSSLSSQRRPQTNSTSSLYSEARPQTSSTSSLSSETRPVAGSTGNLIGESEQQASTKRKRCRSRGKKNKPLPEKNITTEITSLRESKSIYKGKITDLHPLLGQIQTERGTLYFPRDNCYLYGLRLHCVELWHVLTIGIEAEYEIGTSVWGVSRVWIGGRDQPPPATLKSLLTCWCKKFSVPGAATNILLQQADLSSPSLFPTIGNDEGMETVEIIQDPS